MTVHRFPFRTPESDRAMMLELANAVELMRGVIFEMVNAVEAQSTVLKGLTSRVVALEARLDRAAKETRPRLFLTD